MKNLATRYKPYCQTLYKLLLYFDMDLREDDDSWRSLTCLPAAAMTGLKVGGGDGWDCLPLSRMKALSQRFLISRVWKLNLGWCFLALKVGFSWPSVDRFCKNLVILMTLGQVKSVPNFCSVGPQRVEKHNIWKNANLNYISALCSSPRCTI